MWDIFQLWDYKKTAKAHTIFVSRYTVLIWTFVDDEVKIFAELSETEARAGYMLSVLAVPTRRWSGGNVIVWLLLLMEAETDVNTDR